MEKLSKYIVPKEEAVYLINKAREGCKDSRDKMVQYNLRLVYAVTMRFKNRGYEIDDLFQIGTIGLINSIDKFDTSYDVEFSTYAVPMIAGEIQRFFRDDGKIKIARGIKEDLYHIKRFNELFYAEHFRQPSIEEIASGLKIPANDVLLSVFADREIKSIHEVVFENDGDPITLMDQMADESKEKWFEKLALNEAIGSLSEQERLIVYLRYYRDQTQLEVANRLGVTQVQISRLERVAISKVRKSLDVIVTPFVPRPKIVVKKERRVRNWAEGVTKRGNKIILKPGRKVIELPAKNKRNNLKREEVFLLFEKGYHKKRIIEETGMAPASYYNYSSLYKKHKEEIRKNKIDTLALKREEKIEGEKGVLEYKSTIITVDIVLLDNSILKNASIFPKEVQNGDESIQNLDDIDALFRKVPVSWKGKWINFQTEYINGTINTDNVKDYKVNIKEY